MQWCPRVQNFLHSSIQQNLEEIAAMWWHHCQLLPGYVQSEQLHATLTRRWLISPFLWLEKLEVGERGNVSFLSIDSCFSWIHFYPDFSFCHSNEPFTQMFKFLLPILLSVFHSFIWHLQSEIISHSVPCRFCFGRLTLLVQFVYF